MQKTNIIQRGIDFHISESDSENSVHFEVSFEDDVGCLVSVNSANSECDEFLTEITLCEHDRKEMAKQFRLMANFLEDN